MTNAHPTIYQLQELQLKMIMMIRLPINLLASFNWTT